MRRLRSILPAIEHLREKKMAPSKEPPSLRLRSPEGTARLLRAHLARHNRHVLLLAAGTLLAAAGCWAILYFVSCWLLLLGFSVLDYPDTHIPPGFGLVFAVAAFCAIAYAWIDQRLTSNAHPRDDKKFGEYLSDFLLAIPHLTLACGGTLRAWLRLSDAELLQAAELLHRLGREKRVPISSVRVEVPNAASAVRVLFALQMTQLIELYRKETGYSLKLNTLRPPAFRLRREDYAGA